MLKRKIGILLLTSIIAISVIGCGSASGGSVSDEDLQTLLEMGDELKTEDDSIKGVEADTVESIVTVEEEVSEQEDDELNSTDASEDAADGELYQIRFNYGVGEKDSEPKIMGFDFEVDGKWVSTEDLTCKYSDGYLYREVTRDNRPGIKDKKEYVKLSPEHLKEVRNIFIEAYNTFFKEYEDKFCEAAKDVDAYIVEVNEECPGKFQINFDGKCVNFIVEEFLQSHWSDYGSGSEDEHTYTVGFAIDARVDSLPDFSSYIENMISEDESKEFSYDDYGIVDNTIKPDTKATESVSGQESNTGADNGSTSESIIGTWYSISDATVITFDGNGNYTSSNPNTGEHSSLKYYNAGGNRYTAYLEDYFDIDYYLKGDTLVGEEGTYKKK